MGRGTKQPPTQVLRGGGAEGGSLDMPAALGRQGVEQRRFQTTTSTVGEALTTRLENLSDNQIKPMAEVLRSVVQESERGDDRAGRVYGNALKQIQVTHPEVWTKLFTASKIDPKKWGKAFHPPELELEQAPTVAEGEAPPPPPPNVFDPAVAEDMAVPEFSPTRILPGERAQYGGEPTVMAAEQNYSPLLAGLTGNDLSEVNAPKVDAAPFTRADFPWTLPMFLGDWRTAQNFYYGNETMGAGRSLAPEMKGAEVIRLLRKFTGRPFFAAPPSGVVSSLNADRGIKSLMDLIEKNIRFNPEAKVGVREQLVEQARQQGVPEGDIPALVQAQLDEMDVSEYPDSLPHLVRDRLTTLEGKVQKSPLDKDTTLQGGYITLPNSVYPAHPEMRRRADSQLLRTLRTQLAKNGELVESVMAGNRTVPERLLRVMNSKDADPSLRAQIDMARLNGGILDLDKLARYWRKDDYIAPDMMDNNLYIGQLPPEIQATLLAQQLRNNDPQYIARLIEPVQRSMDLLNLFPAPPLRGGARPQKPLPPFKPNKAWMKGVEEWYRNRGINKIPLDDLRTRPGRKPAAPDMTDTGMMQEELPYQRFRSNPLASLIG